MPIKITSENIEALNRLSEASSFEREDAYWEKNLELQEQGARDIYIQFVGEQAAGFVIFNRRPVYSPFLRFGISEIQDLFVAPEYRGRGFGREMILCCEQVARNEGCSELGIGVGLHPAFGPAQRLYCSMGYVPDGQGVTYNRQSVAKNEMVRNDDDLSLMMVKVF